MADKDCLTGFQCSTAATTDVCRCNKGLDICVKAGVCKPIPPPLSPCERCSNCLDDVAASLQPKLIGPPSGYPSIAAAWCSSKDGYSQSGCAALQSAIAGSIRGNLALRNGAVCTRLGECSASQIAAHPCGGNVTAGTRTGSLDVCTMEGVAGGAPVPGIFSGSGKSSASWYRIWISVLLVKVACLSNWPAPLAIDVRPHCSYWNLYLVLKFLCQHMFAVDVLASAHFNCVSFLALIQRIGQRCKRWAICC